MNEIVTLTVPLPPLELELWAEVTPFRPGQYAGPPELCYPDEGGEFDGFSDVAICLDGRRIYISADELSHLLGPKAYDELIAQIEEIACDQR